MENTNISPSLTSGILGNILLQNTHLFIFFVLDDTQPLTSLTYNLDNNSQSLASGILNHIFLSNCQIYLYHVLDSTQPLTCSTHNLVIDNANISPSLTSGT